MAALLENGAAGITVPMVVVVMVLWVVVVLWVVRLWGSLVMVWVVMVVDEVLPLIMHHIGLVPQVSSCTIVTMVCLL